MIYRLSYQDPTKHYIDIEFSFNCSELEKAEIQLPAWRPGRYELGNFAKNIQKWQAFDQDENPLKFQKLTKDLWEVECSDAEEVVIKYNYFAFELNAGSTYLDESQLYVNPVNCFLYLPDRPEEECQLELSLPENYQVAIALTETDKFTFQARDFDHMADSPFIASDGLQKHSFKVEKTNFHLWFQGTFKPDWKLLEKDFKGFAQEQIKLFGDFPVNDYHFLFQILHQSFYHGVEHSDSTVIALGPSYAVLDKKGRYEDLLGVSSHELFHTWNIKRIRPIEMWPYDFSKENYSKLGYLAEGATTWYGDIMLYRSKVFGDEEFFRTFNQLLDRHYNNPGVHNLSVADSSFDTWLDGYSAGVPNRKSSIYTEGALITFMLDVIIRKSTNNQHSFDEVIRTLYQDYFKQGKGIREEDYQKEVEKLAGKNLSDFFESYVNGTEDISKQFEASLDYLGLTYKKLLSEETYESYLGFKMIDNKVAAVYPNSEADRAGMSIQDEVISINGIKIENNLSDWTKYFLNEELSLQCIDQQGRSKSLKMQASKEYYYAQYKVSKVEKPSKSQQSNFDAWMETRS